MALAVVFISYPLSVVWKEPLLILWSLYIVIFRITSGLVI